MSFVVDTKQGAILQVKVVPNASRSEVAEIGPDVIRIRLQAPAVEGKANKALVEFLADALNVRARQITILTGDHSRQKRVLIADLSAAKVARRLVAG